MISSTLQEYIKQKYQSIPYQGFTTIKELDDADDITKIPKKDTNPYQNWQDVPFDYLNQHFTGISQLSPEGFLFYTPAILYQVLEDFDERKNDVSLIWWLYELDEEIVGEKFLNNISLFNKEQLLILISFLEKLIPTGIMGEQKLIHIISVIKNIISDNT